jgi:hypothetical protein
MHRASTGGIDLPRCHPAANYAPVRDLARTAPTAPTCKRLRFVLNWQHTGEEGAGGG